MKFSSPDSWEAINMRTYSAAGDESLAKMIFIRNEKKNGILTAM